MRSILLLLSLALFQSTGAAAGPGSESMAGVSLAAGSVFRDCADCPELVVIPPGRFLMGYDGGEEGRYEGPIREVGIARPFAAGRYAVTNAEYARFVAETGHPERQGCNYWDPQRKELLRDVPSLSWRDPGHGRPIRDDEPVVCVSWLDSQAFVRWLSGRTGHHYRLLTEAEWEYLARDGTTTAYPWGDDANEACAHANVADLSALQANITWGHVSCDDGHAGLAPVGSFPPNSFGLYDLIGNVWEWVEDCYIVPYPARPVDGSAVQAAGDCGRRSVRGGAWITDPFRQRPSWRGRDPEDLATFIFGFRIARELP